MEQQLILFDYNTLDAETRIVVQQRAVEIKDLVRSTAENIMRVGEKLLEVQVKLGNGKFDAWLEAEFNWSRRTAYNFIGVFKEFRDRANFAQMDIATSALYLLSAPSTPESAKQEILIRAGSGEPISHTTAKAVVEAHRTAEEESRPKQGSFEQGEEEQGSRGEEEQGREDEDQEWLDEAGGEVEERESVLPPPPPAPVRPQPKAAPLPLPAPAPKVKEMESKEALTPTLSQREREEAPVPVPPPPPPAPKPVSVPDFHLHVTIKSTGICLVTLTQVGKVEPLANLSVHRSDLTSHIEQVLVEKVK